MRFFAAVGAFALVAGTVTVGAVNLFPKPKEAVQVHPLLAPIAANSTPAVSSMTPEFTTELTDHRTETSKTFLSLDGTYQTELYPGPVHFRSTQGDWVPINNSLIASDSPGYIAENKANNYTLLIPDNAVANPVRFEVGQKWVTFSPKQSEGTPDVEGNVATINGIDPSIQFEYQATSTGVKETILLHNPADARAEYLFDLDTSATVTPRMAEDGGVDFLNDVGQPVFRIPPPFMVDGSGTSAGFSEAVSFELRHVGDAWQLAVAPSQTWLADDARVYPVRIDPTITTNVGVPNRDCWISESYPTTPYCGQASPYIRVGSGGASHRRGLLDFQVDAIPSDAAINEADLWLHLDATESTSAQATDYVARRVTRSWTNSATWKSYDGTNAWSSLGGDYASSPNSGTVLGGTSSGYKSFPVPLTVQSWVSEAESNYGLIVKQQSEGTPNVLSFFSSSSSDPSRWPKLVVTYTSEKTVSTVVPDLSPEEQWLEEIDPYVERLMSAAESYSNFASAEVDYTAKLFKLMGVGEPAPEVATIMSEAPTGLGVQWVPVPYSEAELDAKAEAVAVDPEVSEIIFADDFSGVVATMFEEATITGTSGERVLPETRKEAIRKRGVDSIPVTFKIGDEDKDIVSTFTRVADVAPFWGGSRIGSNTGGCSTGFPAEFANNGDDVMVFAAHCSTALQGIQWRMQGNGAVVGTSGAVKSWEWDAQVINGQEYGNHIYFGGAKSNDAKAINGSVNRIVKGDKWCLSGSYSGDVCGMRVVRRDLRFRLDPGLPVTGPAVILSRPGIAAAGNGDSGGPSFKYRGLGVRIAGIISAQYLGQFTEPCRGVPTSEFRKCSSRIVVSPWRRFRDDLALSDLQLK